MDSKRSNPRAARFPQIRIDQSTYDQTKAYADEMGLTLSAAVNQALQDWLDTVGAARLEHHRSTRKTLATVVNFPPRRASGR